jgi:hypothetical protein
MVGYRGTNQEKCAGKQLKTCAVNKFLYLSFFNNPHLMRNPARCWPHPMYKHPLSITPLPFPLSHDELDESNLLHLLYLGNTII